MKYFKLVYWGLICAILFTGCSRNRTTEENIFMNGGKESLEEEKRKKPEMER